MGLMDYIYRFFGFEGDDVKVVKKKPTPRATYNLKVSQKLPDEIDGVRVYYPQTLGEAKEKAEMLRKNTPFFIDFRGCSSNDKASALDYFEGVIDVLGAKMELVEKNLYIFLPKNMDVEKE